MADTSNSVLFDAPGPKGRRTIRIVNWIAGILFAVVLVLILMRLHNPPDGENQLSWELWKPAIEREAWTDFYLPGLWMTIKATVVAVVGAVVLGSSYLWGISQAKDWLSVKKNREGNFLTVAGRASDAIAADMAKSPSNFLRDGVSTAMVVAFAPLSAILLIL